MRERMSRPRWPLTLALCSGYFLVLLDVTIVNVALPQLGAGLAATASGLAWVVDAYAVPLAALLLAAGAVGDRIGHRRVVVLGFVGFGVASLLCAAAPSIGVLVAGRAVQGAAAALMLPGTLALVTASAPTQRQRTRAVALWAAVGGAALPAGPLLGGILVSTFGWRSVFLLGLPIIASALLPVLALRERELPAGAPVDWSGAALLVIVLGCVVAAVIEHAIVLRLSLLTAAAVAGLLLWRVERSAARPLLRVPRGALTPLLAACGVAGMMNLCMLGSLFVLTQVLQDVHGLGALSAGLLMLPMMLPVPALAPVSASLVRAVGPWQTAGVGSAVVAAGLAGLAATTGRPAGIGFGVALAAVGAGIGVLTPAIVMAAVRAVPDAPGVASGASNAARQTAGAIGVALYGAIAGSPAGADFVPRVTGLFIAAAIGFAVVSALCAIRAVRRS